MNAVLLELGFLERLRESRLWPRIGWIYGSSAGALTGRARDRGVPLRTTIMRADAGDHSLDPTFREWSAAARG